LRDFRLQFGNLLSQFVAYLAERKPFGPFPSRRIRRLAALTA
jgi:hypothetical protein